MDSDSAQRRHERQIASRKRPDPDNIEITNGLPGRRSQASGRPAKRARTDASDASENGADPEPQPGWPRPAPAPPVVNLTRAPNPQVVNLDATPTPRTIPAATNTAPLPGNYRPYRLIDLTSEDPQSPRPPPREEEVVVVGERGRAQVPVPPQNVQPVRGFNLGNLVVLDILFGNQAPAAPRPPPLDLSGGYWARRRAGKLRSDEVGADEKAGSAPQEGTLPGKDCPICLSPISDITAAICGHVFCEECVLQAIHHQGKCPKCRRALTLKDIHPLFI